MLIIPSDRTCLTMTDTPRPAPFFVGEHAALDFLNSVAQPRSVLYDWLETGQDLLDWMVAAQLVTDKDIAAFRNTDSAAALDAARAEIVAFRERFRAFIASTAGVQPTDAAHPVIKEINAILARGVRTQHIKAAEGRLTLTEQFTLKAPADLILRIASAAAHLITQADFHHVRNCECPTCTLYFLDVSKNHKRRWCSMEVCGNRAKAAAYRKR